MALIVLTSAAGAPGVTSSAVGLALTWRRSVIVVDADPGAYQAVLAGYLRGQISTGKGMQRVAEAHRDRRPLAEVVSDETVPLTDEPGPPSGSAVSSDSRASTNTSRRLLPGFAKPANAALFAPVWPDLADTLVGYEDAGIDVIVDAGRMDREGLPQPLVDRADLVIMVTRSNLRSIAAARGCALRLREQGRLTGNETNLGLILIGENQPYGRREIGNLLAMPVLSVIAEDKESAAVFSDGAGRNRKFARSALAKSLHRSAEELTAQIRRRRARLGLDDPGLAESADLPVADLPVTDLPVTDLPVTDLPVTPAATSDHPSLLPDLPLVPDRPESDRRTAAAGPPDPSRAAAQSSSPGARAPGEVSAMNAWIRAGSAGDGDRDA